MRQKTTSLLALSLFLFIAASSLLRAQFAELHPGYVMASDSIPPGVNEQWLREARDENGNRIYSEENEGDAFQRRIFNGFLSTSESGQSARELFAESNAGTIFDLIHPNIENSFTLFQTRPSSVLKTAEQAELNFYQG